MSMPSRTMYPEIEWALIVDFADPCEERRIQVVFELTQAGLTRTGRKLPYEYPSKTHQSFALRRIETAAMEPFVRMES